MKKRIIQVLLVFLMIIYFSGFITNTTEKGEVNKSIGENHKVANFSKSTDLYSGVSYELTKFIYYDEDSASNNQLKSWRQMWTTDDLNVRKEPSIDSKILGLYKFNTPVFIFNYNNGWGEVIFSTPYDSATAYVKLDYLSDVQCPYTEYKIQSNKGFKSYMSYKAIKDVTSNQYLLQKYAYTGNYGIRQIKGRYCVAIGTAFGAEIGDYAEIILENNEVIPIIVSDIKNNKHTDSSNIFTISNGCASEFICDTSLLNNDVITNGDISFVNERWNSKVAKIKIYNKNIFYQER